jgi:SAM-dependent methyltransferase
MRLRGLRGRVRNVVVRLILALYYRYVYGGRPAALRWVAPMIYRLEERDRKGNIPMPAQAWNEQYVAGQWDYMRELDELGRYSMLAGYFRFLKPGGSLLDIGCGEGILQARLGPASYSRYLGVDVSSEAIRRALHRADEKTSFVCADAAHFCPDEHFDVVVFNESLYYFGDPVGVFKRYLQWLNDDGIVLVSTFSSPRSLAVRRAIRKAFPLVDEVRVIHGRRLWICDVMKPIRMPSARPRPRQAVESTTGVSV